jgi:hypothetical protein
VRIERERGELGGVVPILKSVALENGDEPLR